MHSGARHLEGILNNSLATSTKNSYKRAYELMKEFHNRIGKELRFPLSKDTVALFIAHMDQKGYTKGTITSYVSARRLGIFTER